MLLVIGLIAAQLVFSGGMLPLDQLGAAGALIADATSTKWVFQGLVAAVYLKSGDCDGPALANCRLPGIQALASDPEKRVLLTELQRQYGDALTGSLAASWLALALILAAIFIALVVVQRRKDPAK